MLEEIWDNDIPIDSDEGDIVNMPCFNCSHINECNESEHDCKGYNPFKAILDDESESMK